MTHFEGVDEFIDYSTGVETNENENYARWMLNHFRLPASLKEDFNEFMKEHKLFCLYKGVKYRVTGASRLGDIWLHDDFSVDVGYVQRVSINDLTHWSKS